MAHVPASKKRHMPLFLIFGKRFSETFFRLSGISFPVAKDGFPLKTRFLCDMLCRNQLLRLIFRGAFMSAIFSLSSQSDVLRFSRRILIQYRLRAVISCRSKSAPSGGCSQPSFFSGFLSTLTRLSSPAIQQKSLWLPASQPE